MDEWVEKGPFRVRVLQEARAEERSFRESASPDRIVEVAWYDEPKKVRGVHPLSLASMAICFAVFVGSNAKAGVTDEPVLNTAATWALLLLAMALFGMGQSAQATRRSLAKKERKATEVRVGPRAVRLTRGAFERTFPKARVEVLARNEHGRHQAVLMSEGEVVAVLHDAHHDFEVDWLVERLNEELAR